MTNVEILLLSLITGFLLVILFTAGLIKYSLREAQARRAFQLNQEGWDEERVEEGWGLVHEPPRNSYGGYLILLVFILLISGLIFALLTTMQGENPLPSPVELSKTISDLELEIEINGMTLYQLKQKQEVARSELEELSKTISDLEREKSMYEQLLSLNREQVEAIALLLSQRQEEENRRYFWIGAFGGLVTNLIAAIIIQYREVFFRPWLKIKELDNRERRKNKK